MPFEFPLTSIRGITVPIFSKQISRFDPVRGWIYTYFYAGTDQAGMIQLANDFSLNGVANTLTLEKDMATLEAIDSTQEYTIDSWEILANEEIRDLFSLPSIVQGISTYVAYGTQAYTNVFTAIRQHIDNNDQAQALFTDNNLTAFFNAMGPLNAVGNNILDFYNLYIMGTTGWRNQQYVLKHKTNVSNRWTVNVADYGINNIYTPAQLLAEVSSYGLWIFPLPARLQYKLANIPPTAPPVNAANFLWGWLKSGSTETTEALNRINIETSYNLDLWDLEIYPAYTG